MMSLSKLWLFLLTLASGLLALVFLLSPVQLRRSMDQIVQNRMALAQQSATLLLSNSARMWIDAATQVAGDASIQNSLEELARGQAEMEVLHKSVQDQLRRVNEALKLSLLIVTDARGRVVARAGQDEAVYKDAIDGSPLVADAVRGYRLDDIWYQDGVLYRMAAAPIISAGRDRYVGAVILGQAVGPDLAQQLQAAVGMDVAFLCEGKLLASSRPADKVPEALVQFVGSNASLLQGGGRTEALEVPGVGSEVVLLVGLPGEAGAQGASLALLGAGAQGTSLSSVLRTLAAAAADGELPWQQLPLLAVGMMLAFLIGLLVLRAEAEKPLRRLAADLREVARRRAQELDEKAYPGAWREVAATINAALHAAPPGQAPVPMMESNLGPGPGLGLGAAEPPQALIPVTTPSLPPQVVFPRPAPPELAPQPVPGSPFAPPSAPYPDPSGSPSQRMHISRESPHSSGMTLPALPPEPQQAPPGGRPPGGIPLPLQRSLAQAAARERAGYDDEEPAASSTKTMHDQVFDAEVEAQLESQLSPMPPEMPTVQDIPSSLVQAAIEQALNAAPAPFVGSRAQARPATGPIAQRAPTAAQTPVVPRGAASGAPAGELRLTDRKLADITEEITAVNSPPMQTEDELEAAFRQTYQEFVVTKQRCREPVEGLTYDKFVLKLRQSREQIMRQHNCKAVRFHVYVKDGKAALKATPVAR